MEREDGLTILVRAVLSRLGGGWNIAMRLSDRDRGDHIIVPGGVG